jgi:hypothetical protein
MTSRGRLSAGPIDEDGHRSTEVRAEIINPTHSSSVILVQKYR